MAVASFLLELLGYTIKVYLLVVFWFLILDSLCKWLGIGLDNPLVNFMAKFTNPALGYLKRKMPFLYREQIDFSPIVAIFIVVLLHLLVVDSLLGLSMRLK